MLIAPGVENPSVANMIELGRLDGKRRINIELQDSYGNIIDIDRGTTSGGDPTGELDLVVTDIADNEIYSESYWPADPLISEPRLIRAESGKYYINFGTVDGEMNETRAVLFNWHARQNATAEDIYRVQVLEVVSARTLFLLPMLRLMLDKTIKPILPEKYCFVGVSDGMLVTFLKLGVSFLNNYQPYPVWEKLDYFPIETHSDILIKAAMYQGVTSNLLFAIDTDVPQYSDQGHSFVLQHATPLASYLQHLKAELDSRVPDMKRQFVNSGTIMVEMRMDMAYGMMLASSPPGNLYRNLWAT